MVATAPGRAAHEDAGVPRTRPIDWLRGRDKGSREDLGDVTIDVTEPNLFIAFRRIDRHHGELITFRFLDESG